MKRVRWKTKYLAGIAKTDEHNKNLINILNNLVFESNQLEHCQDLSDLHRYIGSFAENMMLEEQQIDKTKLKHIITTEIPLHARNTQACHDCGLCDLLNQQIIDWIELD
ncbi:MAG: hypothetical protein IMF12_10285 [Proteobacteria bacterium]|nr:hypothetical protein [Pseudomonadota bacterium]